MCIRDSAYHERFREEKLFWMDLTPEGRFSYAPEGTETFCANTVYFMHGPMMKLLAAFLNSSLITWYVKKNTVTSGMGTARWFAVTVEAIPIPIAIDNARTVNVLVDNLLAAMDDGAPEKVQALESEIEDFVFESYGISAQQRQAIEKSALA